MKIADIYVGQKVRDKYTKFEFVVVGVGVINLDMDGAYVYCDFKGNDGDVFEYTPNELEPVND